MVIVLRPLTVAALLTSSQSQLLSLFLVDLQVLLTPKTIYPLEIDISVLLAELDGDPTIPIPGMFHMECQYLLDQRSILLGLFALISLGTASLT